MRLGHSRHRDPIKVVKIAEYLENGVENANYNVEEINNLLEQVHFPDQNGFYNDSHTPKRLTEE